jgi:MoaA/NifB/PqqE/SkfB family radical SAM enzyme
MLTGIHFLLTYTCSFECDHCFVYSSPEAKGTFTIDQIKSVFDEIKKIDTIEWIYFEGGEPFLFYPVMLEGIKIARSKGYKTGIVTNAYWATSVRDAEIWLKPLSELEISDLSVSDDLFHQEDKEYNSARFSLQAAERLKLPSATICIEKPTVEVVNDKSQAKGKPIIGGGVRFRGRAADKLIEGLPRRPYEEFFECPHENLENPERVHIDSYGNVHICQGLSMGNMWEIPLSNLIMNYDVNSHPICRPLNNGGPVLLAKEYNVMHDKEYVDVCHFCYSIRRALIDKFAQYLVPRQIYGLE